MLEPLLFYTLDKLAVKAYELRTSSCSVVILNYGATIHSYKVKNEYEEIDIVLGFDNPVDYVSSPQNPYFGAIVGRTCNRIKGGKFELDGKRFQLDLNNGPNSLHGGYVGFNKLFWDVISTTESCCVCTVIVPHMDQNYPGEIKVTVSYELIESSLTIRTEAELLSGAKSTIVNITSHPHFNLSGCIESGLKHSIEMKSIKGVLELDNTQIPTGRLYSKNDNPEYYFEKEDLVENRIQKVMQFGGFDHFYLVDDFNEAVTIKCEKTKLSLTVSSTCPGFQLYTDNWINVDNPKRNHACTKYGRYAGICIEPSQPPNAINIPEFRDMVIVTKEKPYNHTITYKINHL